jgi:phosphate starvation-inducible protein PhoH
MSDVANITFEPVDNVGLSNLCGAFDENLRQIATALEVNIVRRGIAFQQFLAEDVVRHPLVQKIVSAYEKHENMP